MKKAEINELLENLEAYDGRLNGEKSSDLVAELASRFKKIVVTDCKGCTLTVLTKDESDDVRKNS